MVELDLLAAWLGDVSREASRKSVAVGSMVESLKRALDQIAPIGRPRVQVVRRTPLRVRTMMLDADCRAGASVQM